MTNKRRKIPNPWDVVIGTGALLLLIAVVVLGARFLDPSRHMPKPHEFSTPEQVFLLTGSERAFLAELPAHVEDSRQKENEYLALAHSWCGPMQGGANARHILDRLRKTAVPLGISRSSVNAAVGVATLRICPDQASALDRYYRGE